MAAIVFFFKFNVKISIKNNVFFLIDIVIAIQHQHLFQYFVYLFMNK